MCSKYIVLAYIAGGLIQCQILYLCYSCLCADVVAYAAKKT